MSPTARSPAYTHLTLTNSQHSLRTRYLNDCKKTGFYASVLGEVTVGVDGESGDNVWVSGWGDHGLDFQDENT